MFATDDFTDIRLPDPQPAADEWAAAACRREDASLGELFFSDQIPDIARAKSICGDCPVIDACLEGAIDRREPWGVWGGQLFANGKILAQKRKRGRPPKNRDDEDVSLTA